MEVRTVHVTMLCLLPYVLYKFSHAPSTALSEHWRSVRHISLLTDARPMQFKHMLQLSTTCTHTYPAPATATAAVVLLRTVS
jgi:hypothetical protein